jgi:hypothetical protein
MAKMQTYDEAVEVGKQITKACNDCPLLRSSLAGWLGQSTPAAYCADLHNDGLIKPFTATRSYCLAVFGAATR